MSRYKLVQLTNKSIGEIQAGDYLPVGMITRKINASTCNCNTFQIASSNSDIVYLNEPGSYKVTYTGSFAAGAAGVFAISLIANQETIFTAQETVAAADDLVNMNLSYVVRVCPNCCSSPANCPMSIQIQLGDLATSATVDSTANLIIEKVNW